MSRRETEDVKKGHQRPDSPVTLSEVVNGTSTRTNGVPAFSQSPPMGFTAVNSRQSAPAETAPDTIAKSPADSGHPLFSRSNTENVTVLNGASIKGISQEQRIELIKSFLVNADIQARDDDVNRRSSLSITRSATQQNGPQTRAECLSHGSVNAPNNSSAVPIPSTPASLLPHLKPTQVERDDGGPYKAEMVNRMETLRRGERILPPCDRCRRLEMDCLKNLTACMGCTKKHAKCSWKDVHEEELRRTASYSPEHGGQGDHAELATPDTSASSHHSPASAAQPTGQEPSASMSRRELDLLPPQKSFTSTATTLTTGTASPSVYASIERKSEAFPPPPPTPTTITTPTSSAPKRMSPDHPRAITTTLNSTGQQLQDASNGLAAAHRSVFTPQKHSLSHSSGRDDHEEEGEEDENEEEGQEDENEEDEEEGEGDRLQALAAQVYRSASAQQNRLS